MGGVESQREWAVVGVVDRLRQGVIEIGGKKSGDLSRLVKSHCEGRGGAVQPLLGCFRSNCTHVAKYPCCHMVYALR